MEKDTGGTREGVKVQWLQDDSLLMPTLFHFPEEVGHMCNFYGLGVKRKKARLNFKR